MHNTESAPAALKKLAAHLAARRDVILAAWRRAVDADPELTTASTITRAQFVDHIPAVLDAFQSRLSAHLATERERAGQEQKDSAAEHGLHRWQQGYNQPETMREWGHLHLCLLDEVEHFESLHPDASRAEIQTVRRELIRLCSEGMCASAARYAHLQQKEAASRVFELESALSQLQLLEQQRAEAWREAAHDLRGRAHAIASASAVLSRDGVTELARSRFSEVLRLGVSSLNRMLGDLMDQARLEAGHERRQLAEFDVAALLRDFCDTTRAVAAEKNLFLTAIGESPLVVEGDAPKIQRIVQNLVLNAIKVTERGGVKITWKGEEGGRRAQWSLCVQDTGPGFHRGSATPLERVLKLATDEAHEVAQRNLPANDSDPQADSAPTLASQSKGNRTAAPAGEGIGLSIVKRLCEMLDASLELESTPGEGTTFRMVFPRQYRD